MSSKRRKPFRVLPGFHLSLGYTVFYLCLIVLIPLSATFVKTAGMGGEAFWRTVTSPRVIASYQISFGASFAAALINALAGLLIAWVLVRYRFPGKRLIDSLVDLPFALPTAVAGIALTALYAPTGWVGKYFAECLVASGWQTFWHVTLPNVKWALFYGVILCNARAMGEFGAVSVVSGHIRGETNTLPLHIEILYNEYNFVAAFACASLLALLALVTLVIKAVVESRSHTLTPTTEP